MKAIISTVRGDVRRRKLQSLIIFIVILLSSLAATLALSLLVESNAPYDRAFATAKGAHLTLIFAGDKVSAGELMSSSSSKGVVATAGPWPVTTVKVSIQVGTKFAPTEGGNQGSAALRIFPIQLVGRAAWDTAVDRLTIQRGHWVQTPRDIVLSRSTADSLNVDTGDSLQIDGAGGPVSLTVVGIAASISPGAGAAWVLPAEIKTLAPSQGAIDQEMLYRIAPSATNQDVRVASQAIASRLPNDSVVSSSNYLDARRDADITTAVMIPFLVAFSLFALVISALIIGNVVSGSVVSSYREIGILKALGMTPAQVISVLILQIVAMALAGCLIGVPLGAVASVPFLQSTAYALGLPAPFTATIPLAAVVFVTILAIATLTATLVAWRAAHTSATNALTMGAAPSSRGTRISAWLLRLPLPRAFGIGVSDTFASPLRSAMTIGAILLGVATVVFALGLHLSLGRIAEDLDRDVAAPVSVNLPHTTSPDGIASISGGGKSGAGVIAPPATMSATQIVRTIMNNPETANLTVETTVDVTVPGIAEPVPYYAYQGDSAWTGYALISGRWFSQPGEVVAPSALVDLAHLSIGDHFNALINGKTVSLTLVGEILDQTDNDLLLRGEWETAAAVIPAIQPGSIEIGLRPGIDAEVYAAELQRALGGLNVQTAERASSESTFRLLNAVIAGLAIVLAVLAVAGVFNTVVLSTRERARDIAILKAVGMAPGQVVLMVVGSVVLLGIIGGGLAIPIGLILHHQILTIMGRVASGTRIPSSDYDVFESYVLVFLGLSGIALSAVGAFIPARWAASGPTAHVLQAE